MSNYVNFIFNMYSIAFLNLGSRKFNFHKLKLAPENLVKTLVKACLNWEIAMNWQILAKNVTFFMNVLIWVVY